MLIVLLFAILVCLCIILLACMWKLVRIFTKVQVEKQIEELDELLKLLTYHPGFSFFMALWGALMLADTDSLSLVQVEELHQSNDFSFTERARERRKYMRLQFRVMWKGHSTEPDENVQLLKTNRDG